MRPEEGASRQNEARTSAQARSRHAASRGASTPYQPAAYGASAGSHAARHQRNSRPERGPRHPLLSALLWLLLLACLGLMGLRCLPASLASGVLVPEAVSFVPLLFIPLILCSVLAILWHRRALAAVSIAALAVTSIWHAGYFLPTARVSAEAVSAVEASASTDDSAARVMTLNTHNGDASAEEIVQLVREYHIEVLCLEELTTDEVASLEAAGIDELLPYSVVSDGASMINNGGRNGIWTASPMDDVSTNLLPINTSSMPACDIEVGGTTVRIVAVHPNSPVRGAEDEWSEGLSVIRALGSYDHAYLICGDFNSTWDHARFRQLLGSSFVDASQQSGQGYHMTYPANKLIPSLIEIDHIVYSKDSGIVVSGLVTETVSGTDHQALIGILEAS